METSLKTTLYKKNKDKIQIWIIEVVDDKYRTTEGFIDGKLTSSEWTVAKPKNIGKKNETTGAQQAISEAQSKVQKKLEKDYVADKDALRHQEIDFSPMLAHDFKKHAHKMNMPVFSQPKLDGIRCNITREGMRTRTRKLIKGAPHIMTALNEFFNTYPDAILDGELYNHSLKEDFNQIISLVRQENPTEDELAKSEELIQFHIYDFLYDRTSNLSFSQRLRDYRGNFGSGQLYCSPSIVPVKTEIIHSLEQLDLYYATYLEDGYEGQMVRADIPYEEKRSYGLLKRKEFITEEYTIVDIEEGDGNRSGMMGRIVLQLETKTFNANALGNVEYYTELWNNREKYIDKQATVKFQNYTPDGVPRFGVVIAIRDYE